MNRRLNPLSFSAFLLSVALLTGLFTFGLASPSSAGEPSSYQLIGSGAPIGKAIQKWLNCVVQTSCTDLNALQKSARIKIESLDHSLLAIRQAKYPSTLRPIVADFVANATELVACWIALPKAPSQAAQLGALGTISITSDDIVSIASTFSSVSLSKPVSLGKWIVGPLNTIALMDNYGRFTVANQKSVPDAIAMDQYTSLAAGFLEQATMGPSKRLNTLISQYASNQMELSDALAKWLKGTLGIGATVRAPSSSWGNDKSQLIAKLDSQIRSMESAWFSQG